MAVPYAVVIGEALWDLLDRPAERCYAQVPGGSSLNVAVGVARLGHPVEFVAAFGDDVLAERLRRFLTEECIRLSASLAVAGQSTLAVTTFDGAEPHFAFYGHPAAYALLRPDPAIDGVAADAAVVHAGSIALLAPGGQEAALSAFGRARGWKTFDPNVRPRLISEIDAYRRSFETLAGRADLVKLSRVDAEVLYPDDPDSAPARILACGAAAVVLTLGPAGALLTTDEYQVRCESAAVDVRDATGAGDATTVGLIDHLVSHGWPADRDDWQAALRRAMQVAGAVCARPGGASAMPTPAVLA
jgi:fructokinase